MKKLFLYILPFLLLSSLAWAESELPECEGSPATDDILSTKEWANCYGTFIFPDGAKYVGEFKDGKPHGQGTMTSSDGTKYVGEFKDGTYKTSSMEDKNNLSSHHKTTRNEED